MIDIYLNTDGSLTKIQKAEPGCWINIYPPFNREILDEVSNLYNIPIDFLTDSLDIDERSRFEREDNVSLIVLNTPVLNDEEVMNDNHAMYITVPIGIILLKDMILTISSFANPTVDCFINKRVKGFDPSDREHFILQLFDRSVFYFLHYLKQINNKRNIFEDELYYSSRNKELSQLMNLQKSLVYFVTTLRSNELLMLKIQRTNFLRIRGNEDKNDFLEDIIIDNSQALEMSNIYTNILNGTMDAFASIISNNLNMVMKRLTSVTIILMVPTLVASFYGMNVSLPMEGNQYAFIFLIFISLFLTVILVWFFLKKEWF